MAEPCPRCGAENRPEARFCGSCGGGLSLTCPNGHPVPPDLRFCDICGAALAQAPADPVAIRLDAATAERRLVTVLFADLVGFTTISESRDPEEVREILSRYFDTCRTLIERYGGVVEKFIGDAVMAVWGAQTANEDDAERAVRTALDLVEAVGELGVEVGTSDLGARAGVLTGEAAVNLGAVGQGLVAGDLVNTASRIQSLAEPGTVVVGEGTHRATEAAIAYSDLGAHELKGKSEPARLWRALRVVAGRGGLMKSEGLEPPFVGRDRELRLVKDLFHSSVEESKAHLVQVIGIAGIGKSRLAWEFFKYMDGLKGLFAWHRGRCLAYGDGVTYWALAEMVRGRAEILEGEDRASAMAKLRAAVERYVPDQEDRAFIEPRLAHLVGLEERSTSDKSDLFAGWRLFFEKIAEEMPVLMVFEDMQWADPSLVEFIDHLLEWSRNTPLFVLSLARPEVNGTPLSSITRNATSMYLEPLAREDMERLLNGLVPGLPPELTGSILERAEGVPLYAVETVRMLLDRGLLVQEGPVYRPTGPIDALEIPESLQALIAARLDGLEAAERRLAQDASVLGKTFTRAALGDLSGLAERDIEPLLASLVAKEILSVQSDPRSPEFGQYGFLQDLVRTVAYETLTKRDRKLKHLTVAAYLERAWGDEEEEIVEVVASHYVDAYMLAPDSDDAAQIRDKARGMLVRAAERAASLAAGAEARNYFRQAAELSDSDLERGELTERAGEMAWLLGQSDEAAATFSEAIRLFAEAHQPRRAARVEARLAEVEFARDHLDQAVERTQRAYDALAGEEPDPELAFVSAQLGRFLVLSGRRQEAAPLLEEALELAEHLQLRQIYCEALNTKSLTLHLAGRLDEAQTLLERALEVALEEGFNAAAQRAYNNLGVLLESLDRYVEDEEQLGQALQMARRTGDKGNTLSALAGSIEGLVLLGRWDEALSRGDEAMQAAELESLEWVRSSLHHLALIHVYRGDMDEATRVLESLGDLSETGHVQARTSHTATRTALLLAQGKESQALATAGETLDEVRETLGLTDATVKRIWVLALTAALEIGDIDKADELMTIVERAKPGEVMPYLRAHAARFAARLAAERGESDAVEQGFLAAEKGLRDLEMPFDLAVVLLEHIEWLAAQERATEAEPLRAEAREIFARLEARPWLERLERTPVAAGSP